jgi:hypothetical protein
LTFGKIMPEKPKVSVGPIREHGTMHVHIPKSDGTTLGLTLAAKPSSESDLQARLSALKKRKRAAAEVRQSVTAEKKRRFNFERGLWRLYLFGAAIWGIAILGMLVLSVASTQRIHRDVFDSSLRGDHLADALVWLFRFESYNSVCAVAAAEMDRRRFHPEMTKAPNKAPEPTP